MTSVSSVLDDEDYKDFENADALKERHKIYCLGLMKITHHYWNGNKKGLDGSYPLNEQSLNSGTYLGHNIAAFAVSKDGNIMDFDFNHNEIFDSSVEHAESRLLRRLFALNQVTDTYGVPCRKKAKIVDADYSNLLTEVTLYTSLESCTQCTGIMNLGSIKDVVYIHTDPGMSHIGNIVWNLNKHNSALKGPRPVSAKDRFDFKYHQMLDEVGTAFLAQQDSKQGPAFYQGKIASDPPVYSKSITSFLCTKAAYDIYGEAASEFDTYKVIHKENRRILAEVTEFVEYAISAGRRGSPHRV